MKRVARGEPGKANFVAGVQVTHLKRTTRCNGQAYLYRINKKGNNIVREMQKMKLAEKLGQVHRKVQRRTAAYVGTMKKAKTLQWRD